MYNSHLLIKASCFCSIWINFDSAIVRSCFILTSDLVLFWCQFLFYFDVRSCFILTSVPVLFWRQFLSHSEESSGHSESPDRSKNKRMFSGKAAANEKREFMQTRLYNIQILSLWHLHINEVLLLLKVTQCVLLLKVDT